MRNDTEKTGTTSSDRPIRKLVLARETLRTLTSDELRLAAGGGANKTRSGGWGCVSW